jgi:hypothetical protein
MSHRNLVAVALLLAAAHSAVCAAEDLAPRRETPTEGAVQVQQWIAELNSDLFAVRQAASRNLREAREAAIGPLAAAADGRQNEVTRRAVDVLDALCESEDAELAEAAREALEKLAHSTHRLPAHRASLVLRGQRLRQQRAALAEIQRLGGIVAYAAVEEGELVVSSLVLGRKWEAGDEGLKYLTKLGRIEQLKLYGQQFTDEGLEYLTKLTGTQFLKIYSTQITDQGQSSLQAALPGTQIDRRHGALLGVTGLGDAKGCMVRDVRSGTAAARAGIEPEDVIIKVNGETIPDMTTLIATIAKQKPGDHIKVSLLRGDQALEKDIVLGELGEDTE